MTKSNLFAAWLSGRTVRKHTMHVQRRENIAEHTWGAVLLLAKYFPTARKELYVAVTLHDVGESGVCDVPLHVFDSVPSLKGVVAEKEQLHLENVLSDPQPPESFRLDLNPSESATVEVVDRAEFVLSCLYEYEMGNRLVLRPLFHGLEKMRRAALSIPETDPLSTGALLLETHLSALTHQANEIYKEIQYG